MTKDERREYMRNYRAENRDQINANKNYWRKRNPEKVKAHAKKAYEKHKDDPEYKAMKNQNFKRWRNNHRAEYNAYQRAYYQRKKLAERSGT